MDRRYSERVRENINEAIYEALYRTTRFTLDELEFLYHRCGSWDDVIEVSMFASTWNIHSASLAYSRWVEREVNPMGIERSTPPPEPGFLND